MIGSDSLSDCMTACLKAFTLGVLDLDFGGGGPSMLSLFSSGFRLGGFLAGGGATGSSGCFEAARVRVALVGAGAGLVGAIILEREDARVGAGLLAIDESGRREGTN